MSTTPATPPPLDALPEPARATLDALREPPAPIDEQAHARMRARFRAMLAEELGDEAVEGLPPAAKSG